MKSQPLLCLLIALSACMNGADDKSDRGPDTGQDSGTRQQCEGPLDPASTEAILDCDQDGIADAEAIAQNTSLDANADGIPDTCQLLEDLTFFGRNDYVSYQAGSLPIILLAPHGGDLEPAEIPQRDGASAPRDANTFELAEAISDAFYDSLGRRPHLIACHLHRYRLDCNRTMEVGAEDNPYAQQAWSEFHGFIDQAKLNATTVFGQALILDLHGMSRTTIEIGTLLRGSQWLESDDRLSNGAFAANSSVRHLAEHSSSSFANLSRGTWSLGALLEDAGYPAIPSPGNPDPGTDSAGDALNYFRGGYNTIHHGSLNGGTVDAIQIEHPPSIRENAQNRADYAQALVASLTGFLTNASDLEINAEVGIRLEAVDDRLSETGNTALLRIHRTGSLEEDLEITLQATGAAVMANDFKWQEKHILPSQLATVDLEISPLDDLDREGPEAFTVRIKDRTGVSPLGDPAEFWIADNEAPSVWVEYLIPDLGEGWESTLLIARDYCDNTADVLVTYYGESDAEDFLVERPENAYFEDQESTLKLTLRPEIDERFEGLQDLIVQVEGEENVSAPSSRWQGWIEDDDIPQNLLGWWDFSHPTVPLLDRVSHQEALLFPTDAPPVLETNAAESIANWLVLDGDQDVIVLTDFPAQGPKNLSVGFSFRARSDGEDGYQYLWSHNDVGDRSSLNIYLTPDGWLRTGFRAEDDDWNYRLLDVETDYRDGEWHQYRFHVDWLATKAQVYLDGQLRADGDLGAGAFIPEGHVFLGGRSDLKSGRHFTGDLAGILFAVGE
jgi:hypothetical protein